MIFPVQHPFEMATWTIDFSSVITMFYKFDPDTFFLMFLHN